MIPNVPECLRLMEEYRMLENIKAHSLVVARIAEYLVNSLIEQDFTLSAELVISSALLHDIGKTSCLETDQDHALVGRDICRELGYADIAEIVAEHVVLRGSYPEQPLSEKELVYYADKRVNHDAIVSLDARLEYILERYGQNSDVRHEAIRRNFKRCRTIEQGLFAHLDLEPHGLEEAVQEYEQSRLPALVVSNDEPKG